MFCNHQLRVWLLLTFRVTGLLIYENQSQYNTVADPMQRMGFPISVSMKRWWSIWYERNRQHREYICSHCHIWAHKLDVNDKNKEQDKWMNIVWNLEYAIPSYSGAWYNSDWLLPWNVIILIKALGISMWRVIRESHTKSDWNHWLFGLIC